MGANYLYSQYESYPLAPSYAFLPTGQFKAIGSADAAGKGLVQAPRYGVQATATYTLHTGVGTFDTTGNVNYQAKQFADPQNKFAIPGRTLVSLTEQWTSSDERTYVTLWVKNLTDQQYDLSYSLLDGVGFASNPGAPRTYGFTVGHKF